MALDEKTPQALKALVEFIETNLATDADTMQHRATVRAVALLNDMALEELQMIDGNSIIDDCFEGLLAQANVYWGREGFRDEWEMDLMP